MRSSTSGQLRTVGPGPRAPGPGPRVPGPERRAPGSPAWRLAAVAVVSWALLSASALASGDLAGIVRSAVVLFAVVLAVALAHLPAVRWVIVPGLGLYALALAAATIVAGGGAWPGAEEGRVELFTGNPNVLGAALVAAFASWAAVAPRRRLVWWGWPLAALAVLHTGSRTSGGALLAAAVVWLVVLAVRRRRAILLAPLLAAGVLAAAALAWQRGVVELTPNLLAAPSDLRDPAWTHERAQHVTITDDAGPGPVEGTTAQRLVGQARPDGRIVVYQSIGQSEEGVPYVASIYLRADEPQRVVLSANLVRTTCDVGPAWQRCVTPVGYGNDRSQRQLLLLTADAGGEMDVHVFGAQYERGEEVTPFVDARPTWIPQAMVNRFDLRRVTFLPEGRVAAWEAGLDIAREHPWFGVGLPASEEAFRERTRETMSRPVSYAHNLAVQALAVTGVVGVAAFALMALATLAATGPTGLARLSPLLVALALLNTWDVTLFDPAVFAPVVLAVAFWVGRGADSGPP
jgi:hypothetical protein